jgi:hypothetical protein
MDSGKNILRYTQPVLAGDKNKSRSLSREGQRRAKTNSYDTAKIFMAEKRG